MPVDVAARLVLGSATHPAMQSLTRFVLMRSVRCRRMQAAYRDQARVMLHLQRERLNDDFRPALWLGALHLLEDRLSEAHRAFEAAERLAGAAERVASAALVCSELLLGGLRLLSPRRRRIEEVVATDPALAALMSAREAAARNASRGGLRVEVVLAGTSWSSAQSPGTLDVRATAGAPVAIEGPGGQRSLTPLEGELLLALLSLLSTSASAGEASVLPAPGLDVEETLTAPGQRRMERDSWTCAIWPSVPGAVGRMDSLFSAAIRSLRLKAWAAARRPVLEVSRRGRYQLLPDVTIRLSMDLPSLVANWLLARTPMATASEALPVVER